MHENLVRHSYIEDFEASNIEDTDEILSFSFDIECHVDTLDEPAKHTRVDLRDESGCCTVTGATEWTDRFRESTDGIDHLIFILTLADVLVTDLE